MSCTRKCSLEIEFSGNNKVFKECVSVSQNLIPFIISKLKRAVSNSSSGYFYIQYLDDEFDLVSVDLEEEIKEFCKLANLRFLEDKPLKLIVKCEKIPDQKKLTSQQEFQELIGMQNPEGNVVLELPNLANTMAEECSYFTQWKMDFKSELKQEILKELRDDLSVSEEPNIVTNEEDSYGNLTNLSGKTKEKLMHNLKKLEKKEKLFGFEIDHRLEKLEMKRKRLLEKASLRAAYRNPTVDPIIGLPFIMSGIVTKDSVSLSKRVTVGKVFVHQWRIVNDGTVPWKDVQLIHNWSSPGLEPDELSLKCDPLLPGQDDQLTIKFRAPKIVGSFVTYWHFVYGTSLKQFGHYVSLSGNTKLPRKMCGTGGQATVQDCKNKLKKKSKAVIVNEEANLIIEADKSTEEEVAHSSEKFLASTEIAAEMAREAAKVLLRRTSEQQADDDLLKKCYEVLNLAESASDTDFNLDDNEETDPEFVMVNIPSTQDNNIQTLVGDTTHEKKETNALQNLKVDGNIVLPPQPEVTENDNNINTNRVMKKETIVSKEVMENAKTVDSSTCEITFIPSNNTPTDGQKTSPPVNMYQQLDQASPLHMPVGYPLQHPMSPHQCPIQSTSSRAIDVPLPAPPNYFTISQANPTVSYPQIPNYTLEMSSEKMPGHQPLVTPPLITYEYPKHPTVIPHVPVSTSIVYPTMLHSNDDQAPTQEEGLDIFRNFNPQSETQVGRKPVTTTQHVNITPGNLNPQPQTEEVATEQPTTNKNPPVQILPQSLVDGAITVASHAYSTAWNALNTFCPKEDGSQTFDPVFENNMVLLMEMGFRNMERNARLLKRYKNDINQVIGIICASPGGDNLEID